MRHDFSDVTESQLAGLFPVLLEDHNPGWKETYEQERAFLQSVFQDKLIRINHIGSTSITGLIAKPTLDILIEVTEDFDADAVPNRMLDMGYIINTPKNDIIMFLKGYTPRGFEGQAVHIHVRHSGDCDELYFRDYLISHPDTAAEYAKLKLKLKDAYLCDRDGYTEAKGHFIRKYTEIAQAEFPGRYIPNVK